MGIGVFTSCFHDIPMKGQTWFLPRVYKHFYLIMLFWPWHESLLTVNEYLDLCNIICYMYNFSFIIGQVFENKVKITEQCVQESRGIRCTC